MEQHDIVPDLLAAIRKQYKSLTAEDEQVLAILEKIDAGKKATYIDAHKYAIRLGELLSKCYADNLSSDILPDGKMWYNIAQRILQPTLEDSFASIEDVAKAVQSALNESAKIGLKVQGATLNQDRIDGIVNRLASTETFDDVSWILESPIVNFCQSVVDDVMEENMKLHKDAGLHPTIVRKATGRCCDWCRSVAGTYEYSPQMDRNVYRRHENCRCTTEYNPGDGKRQDVWTKTWLKGA